MTITWLSDWLTRVDQSSRTSSNNADAPALIEERKRSQLPVEMARETEKSYHYISYFLYGKPVFLSIGSSAMVVRQLELLILLTYS